MIRQATEHTDLCLSRNLPAQQYRTSGQATQASWRVVKCGISTEFSDHSLMGLLRLLSGCEVWVHATVGTVELPAGARVTGWPSMSSHTFSPSLPSGLLKIQLMAVDPPLPSFELRCCAILSLSYYLNHN